MLIFKRKRFTEQLMRELTVCRSRPAGSPAEVTGQQDDSSHKWGVERIMNLVDINPFSPTLVVIAAK